MTHILAKYATTELTTELTRERVLTAGSGITLTDGGDGAALTVAASGDIAGSLVRYSVSGTLAALTDVGGVYIAPVDMTIAGVYIHCGTSGSAGSTIVDVNINGTTIFTTQGNRPTLAYNDTDKVVQSGTISVTLLPAYSVLSVDIDQIATGAANLSVVVVLSSSTDIPVETPPSGSLDSYKLGSDTDNVVLSLGSGGAFDDTRILHPCAVEYEGTIYLFYAGGNGSTWKIGLATAPVSGFTGVNFTKYGSNPILSTGAGGSWDASYIQAPYVIYDPDSSTWKMWYNGVSAGDTTALGYATASSPYGPWTKYVSNPVLSPAGSGWEGSTLGWVSILRESASSYKMLYTGGTITTNAGIGLATSSDGVSWTKSGSNPVIAAAGSDWMRVSVFAPRSLIKLGSLYYVYFSGKEPVGEGFSRIGYGSSSDLVTWTVDNTSAGRVITATRTWEGVGDPPGETENAFYIQVGTVQYLFYDCWWGTPSTIGVAVIP